MNSIRARLLLALLGLVAVLSIASAALTYRRVLNETSLLFDYQLRQMALTLRNQISVAPRIEVPPDQGDVDLVIQIWDAYGARVYLSRPGLPMLNQAVLGFADLSLRNEPWRAYGLQTVEGVIQIAQPLRVRAKLAGEAALRVVMPLLLLLPVIILCVLWIVEQGLSPLRHMTAEVQRRDALSLTPLRTTGLAREILPLVAELNRLLGRLHAAFSLQRAFVADAAHELRSPLTALRLQLQLLDRAPDPAAAKEARGMLGAATDRAIHLVEQLLTLARLDPSEAPHNFTKVDLSVTARDAIADCHAMAYARDIELSFEGAPTIIQGDPDSLRVMVRNLIDNAVRYTPARGTVRVVLESKDSSVLLQITDTGPGIAAADKARVFDRFYRATGSQELGSGLGLSIVKAAADRHAATVVLEEATGGGLHVSVRFQGRA